LLIGLKGACAAIGRPGRKQPTVVSLAETRSVIGSGYNRIDTRAADIGLGLSGAAFLPR
jgi:hypothetical protein